MVGVFVAFTRVVYGRMIYMSLPFTVARTERPNTDTVIVSTDLMILVAATLEIYF